jgi:uncharacterized DUF497 family protein
LEGSSVAFSWDEANVRHLARHRVTPEEAEQCYRNDPLIIDEQYESGEERYLALGETRAARRLAFVFTVRGERIRFVTAYPMTREQEQKFEEG